MGQIEILEALYKKRVIENKDRYYTVSQIYKLLDNPPALPKVSDQCKKLFLYDYLEFNGLDFISQKMKGKKAVCKYRLSYGVRNTVKNMLQEV